MQTLTQAELHQMARNARATPSSSPAPSVAAPSPTTTATPRQTRSPGKSPTRPADQPSRDGWKQVREKDGTYSYVRRFEVEGGQTTIRAVSGKMILGSATPNPGYSVNVEQSSPDRLLLRFISRDRVIMIDALWWEGRPFVTVTPLGG
ncbi:hypothetical protein MRQ36_02095 [Micromonospora sp. R77]|uniref:hypothetical protein n=1 Tax=Micromonospora sp. R77 TaxID=2925836 RepID=UPI001F603C9C|nr:hypothetical protein [Micromonospora sp. R77]MCI4061433.1 hypothetical protein [Micromonospora sp. R77]